MSAFFSTPNRWSTTSCFEKHDSSRKVLSIAFSFTLSMSSFISSCHSGSRSLLISSFSSTPAMVEMLLAVALRTIGVSSFASSENSCRSSSRSCCETCG